MERGARDPLYRGRETFTTVSDDRTVRLWNGADGSPAKSLNSGGDPLLSAALSPDGKRAAAGGSSGLVICGTSRAGVNCSFAWTRRNRRVRSKACWRRRKATLPPQRGIAPGVRWRVGGRLVAPEPFSRALDQPEQVLKALHGEATAPVKIGAGK